MSCVSSHGVDSTISISKFYSVPKDVSPNYNFVLEQFFTGTLITMSDPAVIPYARRRRGQLTFAARFVVLSAIGIIIQFVFAAGNLLAIAEAFTTFKLIGAISSAVFPTLELMVSLALIAGFVGTFRRDKWAMKTVQVASILSLFGGTIVLGLILFSMHNLRGISVVIAMAVTIFRLAFATLCLWMYRTIWADFYFGDGSSETPRSPVVAIDGAGASASTARATTPRFRVIGVERKTGQPIDFLSKAATPEKARKSAEVLGADPDSVRIEPISDPVE